MQMNIKLARFLSLTILSNNQYFTFRYFTLQYFTFRFFNISLFFHFSVFHFSVFILFGFLVFHFSFFTFQYFTFRFLYFSVFLYIYHFSVFWFFGISLFGSPPQKARSGMQSNPPKKLVLHAVAWQPLRPSPSQRLAQLLLFLHTGPPVCAHLLYYTVRPRDTRPQAARTSTMHVFE